MKMAKCALAVCVLSALVIVGCSRNEERPKAKRTTCAAVKSAVRGIYRLENAVADGVAGPKFTPLDVAGLSAKELKDRFSKIAHPESAHLWMPGEKSWLVVEHVPNAKVSLAKALDAVAADETCLVTVPEIFASYAGTLAEVMPAFAADLRGDVVPDWFVPETVRAVAWIDPSGVDGDLAKVISDGVRSMRNVRREVLRGNIVARTAKDKAAEEAACEHWARAYLRNAHDPILEERIDNLENNARGFLKLGQVVRAMKCYETIILIDPKNGAAVHNFGLCLKKIGKTEMADKVLKRAEMLLK